MKKLALDHKLLPETQYGAPGRSITDALKAMLGTLADRGVATWFLRVIHLFLSDRSIVLKLPQSVSDPFLISIGIPQGSRLSPLLFLFYTAPLLIILAEEIKKLDWPYAEVYIFAYVDDTYIMAVSPSYEENCSILKVFHDLIMKWAIDAYLSFSPEKSLVMHFQPGVSDDKQKSDQRKREALGLTGAPKVELPCTLLPGIDELRNNPKGLQPEKLLVLGLMLDPKLSFEHHLTHIEEKVKTALMYQRRISGANWGMTLEKTRQYYICKIRPVISYACAACTAPEAAVQVHQAVVLEKECYIDSIEFFLYRMSRSCRSKSLKVRCHDFWFNKVPQHDEDGRFHEKFHDYNESAFDVLQRNARVLVKEAGEPFQDTWKCPPTTTVLEAWIIPANRNRAIRQQAIRQATETTTYQPPAFKGEWGGESLAYHRGMTRPESTPGMQLRTECVGLNWCLNKCHVFREVKSPGSDTVVRVRVEATCTCGHPNQTVYHMFMECPDLHDARLLLIRKVKHFGWETLLTTNLKVAVHWAMIHDFRSLTFGGPPNLHKTQYIFLPQNPAITPLSSQISRYAVPLIFALSWFEIMTSLSQRLGLPQYPLGLPLDALEPLVVRAAANGLDEYQLIVAWSYPSEQLAFKLVEFPYLELEESFVDQPVVRLQDLQDLATKGCQLDAAGIVRMLPGRSDFHGHITEDR
ncbi:uncharacterized protein FFUJ_05556 [Fusarium fujikuroi IMI 58289]|uniref:Reverse transcriptase domain-containing protein n=1 Tax=Gibberella fujikuroi (strain CBS 195.34 / IMI 58289 / NRRL A-6831) TaxID=1279085 RepID=S0E7A0_GIBF5|nr:uncharacterized protein FFUJ_05556 [Fusarium fujikuroi IMI 58289]CCT70731.1 uncharacterized protein FFUJ_05556 [Fusarium fujikuroi IMI 58289]